jgi:hypothetical protein
MTLSSYPFPCYSLRDNELNVTSFCVIQFQSHLIAIKFLDNFLCSVSCLSLIKIAAVEVMC